MISGISAVFMLMSPMQKVTMPSKRTIAVSLPSSLLALPVGLAACGSSSSRTARAWRWWPTRPRRGPIETLIPAFQATSEGKGVTFSQSYGPSGEQSRAVANGLHADVVNFSLEPDVTSW